MGIYSIKPKFQKFLNPVKKIFIRQKVHPTTINLLALLLSILGGLALYFQYKFPLLLITIPFISFVRMALNALDGLIARELKVKNQAFGEVLNETIDRFSDVIMFIGLALSPGVNYYIGSISIILILLNSYLSILSKAAGGSRQYGGIMGKSDRVFYLSIAAILVYIFKEIAIFDYFFIFLIITTIVTFIQRFNTTKKEIYKS